MNRLMMASPPSIIPRISSSIPLFPLGRAGGFHSFEFGVDLVGRFEFGDFLFEAFRAGHPQSFGSPFGEVGTALEDFEARESILGAAAVEHLACLGPGDGALEAGR